MKLDELKMPKEECCMCRQPLREGRHLMADGVSCEDCYFRALSDLVESSPPGHAGVRRG